MQSLLIGYKKQTLSAPKYQARWSRGFVRGTRARHTTVPCAVTPQPQSIRCGQWMHACTHLRRCMQLWRMHGACRTCAACLACVIMGTILQGTGLHKIAIACGVQGHYCQDQTFRCSRPEQNIQNQEVANPKVWGPIGQALLPHRAEKAVSSYQDPGAHRAWGAALKMHCDALCILLV